MALRKAQKPLGQARKRLPLHPHGLEVPGQVQVGHGHYFEGSGGQLAH